MNEELDVFLFPHQDDEFGVFNLLDKISASGRKALAIYVTDGAYGRATAAQRESESRTVLGRIGIPADRIWFLGREIGVPNPGLRLHLHDMLDALATKLSGVKEKIRTIYVPAWEGGHPDHDATALLGAALQRSLGLIDSVNQFPLYNAYRCTIRPYRVLVPITEAGIVKSTAIPLRARVRHLSYCWFYRSQTLTFVGLFPFIFSHYVLKGTQQLQRLDTDVLASRPHPGPLLYERRGWLTFSEFEASVASFRTLHGIPLHSTV